MNTADYLRSWLADREAVVQRSTFEAETEYINRHIIPYFCKYDLEALRPPDIQSYTRYKLRSGRLDRKPGGLSLVSVKKHLSVIRQALRDAVLLGYIQSNPASETHLPRRKSAYTARTVFLTADSAQKLLDGFKGHYLRPAVILALYYGLRRSEVLGLRWGAVDFERETLTICHTVVKFSSVESKDTTKTESSRRTFQLIPEVREMLEALRPESFTPSDYILHRSDGRPYRPDTLTRQFEKQVARLGLPPMRFHDLRHSTASILFDRGWSLEDVKQWLGHSDIETTSNIYLHYRRERKVMLAGNLVGMFRLERKI